MKILRLYRKRRYSLCRYTADSRVPQLSMICY